jgi:hypothetical protein
MPLFSGQREGSWMALYIGSDIYQTWFLGFIDVAKTPDITRYRRSPNYRESPIGRSEVVLVCTSILFTQTSLRHYSPRRCCYLLEADHVFETGSSVEKQPNSFPQRNKFWIFFISRTPSCVLY